MRDYLPSEVYEGSPGQLPPMPDYHIGKLNAWTWRKDEPTGRLKAHGHRAKRKAKRKAQRAARRK